MLLEIKNLQVAYGGKPVLKGLDLSLENGKVHGLVGLNGAGKTTFLNTLFGFVKAQSGQIIYNGAPLQREQVGFLETNPAFYRNLTGREFLRLYQNEHFKTDAWEDLLQVPLDMLIDHYSTGIKSHPNLSPALKSGSSPRQMNFTEQNKQDLLAFLNTLNDEGVLAAEHFSDPFKQ